MQGIDNGTLYKFAAANHDLCFTRDAEFSRRIRNSQSDDQLKLVRVVIPQPGKMNLSSNSSSRSARQIGQAR